MKKPKDIIQTSITSVALIFFAIITSAESPESEQEVRQFRVLDSQEVDLGDRSIIFNRVETPILKPQPVPLATPAPTPAPIPSAEELAEQARWDAFPQMNLFMSCTVYDDALSQGSFHHEGVNVVFWSTINFHYLSQTYDLMTPDCYYYLFVAAGDSTKEEFESQSAYAKQHGFADSTNAQWPEHLLAKSAPPEKATWHIVSPAPPPEAIKAIEDIHSYFEANKVALIQQHADREAAQLAHEQWLQANPPQPKDTVIYYFPIKSSFVPPEIKQQEAQ